MSFEQILQDHASAMRELAGAITLFTGMYDRVVEQHLPARPARPALQGPAAAPGAPETVAPAPKPAPVPTPAATAEPETGAPTLETLRERFEAISKAGHREQLKQLIREIGGVPTLAKCDPAHYGALLAAAEALAHG
jgi:hypothetical protein